MPTGSTHVCHTQAGSHDSSTLPERTNTANLTPTSQTPSRAHPTQTAALQAAKRMPG